MQNKSAIGFAARARSGVGINKRWGKKTGLRQATISLIETGHPSARIQTLLDVLAALDLEFHITPRSKGNPGKEGRF